MRFILASAFGVACGLVAHADLALGCVTMGLGMAWRLAAGWWEFQRGALAAKDAAK